MFNVKTFLRQAAMALVLAGSSLAAVAGPLAFHVNLNTAALPGKPTSGFVDLQFSSLATAAPLTVTLSNFTSDFGAVDFFDGDVRFNANGSFTLSNLPEMGSLLSLFADFGGTLGFDVLFSDSLAGSAGTDGVTLTVGLLDLSYAPIGNPEGVARFDLQPGVGLVTSIDGSIVSVVPEPSDWLLMLTGVALMAGALRRRQPR